MQKLILLPLVVLLASCSLWPRSVVTEIALPEPAVLSCCWQSQEQLHITTGTDTESLLSITERSAEQLTVAILSPAGQPLVLLRHDRRGVHAVEVPPGWDTRLNRAILAAIYLHQLASDEWIGSNPAWSVRADKNSRALLHEGKIIVLIQYPEAGKRSVHYPGYAVHLAISTLSRTSF